jgi:flagellar biosynthesis chaperone FliJ
MNNQLKNRTISLPLAILLMVLIAAGGIIAFTVERNDKKQLLAEKEGIMKANEEKVLAVYNRIEKNLASIREKESMISQGFAGPEYNSDLAPEDQIQNEINFIKNLIDENNKLIASLNDQIGEKDSRISGYQKSIKDYQAKVTVYQQQLDQLIAEKEVLRRDLDNTIQVKDQLATQVNWLDSAVDRQNSIIAGQQQELTEKEKALHTAYYRIDTYKTLRDQNILEKEGGFLGINRVTTLSDQADNNLFSRIDTREVVRIPVAAKQWEIVTGQDPTSYDVVYESNNNIEWINITDPDKFWGKTKYLVVVVRENSSELASNR